VQPDRLEVSASVDAALAFLQRDQRPSGEFSTFMARDTALTQERRFDSTPFATTYILHSLSFIEGAEVRAMIDRALDFLEAEMEPGGVWRHWTSQHAQHGFIPPDLDDTCCASAVLHRFGRAVPPNRDLILANRNRSDLFYTWLVPRLARTRSGAYWSVTLRQVPLAYRRWMFWRVTEAGPRDVDCVVNANVLHYLGDCPEAEPVAGFLSSALERDELDCCDKWHLSACAFYYAVSRASAGGVGALARLREPLAAHADRALADGHSLVPAEVALAVCALINLERRTPALEVAVSRLLATQMEDGAWPAHALYHGGPNRVYGWGSEALTTALCVEALVRSTAIAAEERANDKIGFGFR
jgi:hypothetical protein